MSPTREALRRLLKHRSAQIGMVILGIYDPGGHLCPVDRPLRSLSDPSSTSKRRDPPCIHLLGCPADKPQHIMGIDGNSRDLFSRVVFGSRLSLQIGLTTITFAILIGGLIGAVAATPAAGWITSSCGSWMC